VGTSDRGVLFGLAERELLPIVEAAAGATVGAFSLDTTRPGHGHYGYSADKLVAKFTISPSAEQSTHVTMFVKRFHEPGPREAHRYRVLAGTAAPIPRMYGHLSDNAGYEVLFLEYIRPVEELHPFRLFLADRDRFRCFLRTMARFNAVRLSEDCASRLPQRHTSDELRNAVAELTDLWRHASAGALGQKLRRFCQEHRGGPQRMQSMFEPLVGRLGEMETGLLHNDLYPDSVGWRRDTGEMVVLDLEMVGFGPRFFDVGRWLGAPEQSCQYCLSREQLAACYLDAYAAAGGNTVSVDRFRQETRCLWTVATLGMLGFKMRRAMDGHVDWTDDREVGRRFYRDDLLGDLRALLGQPL